MRFLKIIFNFYINSCIHVAIAVCALVGVTLVEFNISMSNDLLGFIFFGTITGYNFVKYAETIRSRFIDLYWYLKIVQILSLLALLYFSLQISFFTAVIAGGFALLTFFYTIPLLKSKNLRSITGLKIIIVAIVWAGVTVVLPLVDGGIVLDATMWLSFAQRLLFIIALTLPFEIRDLKYDELALGTLPQRLGVFQSKFFGIVLLVISFLIEFLKAEPNWAYAISFGLICLVLILFLILSKRKQTKYFASFWVESIPILWFAMIFLFFK
jgi:hypothetical protein